MAVGRSIDQCGLRLELLIERAPLRQTISHPAKSHLSCLFVLGLSEMDAYALTIDSLVQDDLPGRIRVSELPWDLSNRSPSQRMPLHAVRSLGRTGCSAYCY